jgi:hypothetical protein
MEKIKKSVLENIWKILTIALALLLFGKGCTNSKISSLAKNYDKNSLVLEKKIDSLNIKVSKMATEKQVRDQMEIIMFNYLIYEDDLDKGKSSLSDIKNKIESND